MARRIAANGAPSSNTAVSPRLSTPNSVKPPRPCARRATAASSRQPPCPLLQAPFNRRLHFDVAARRENPPQSIAQSLRVPGVLPDCHNRQDAENSATPIRSSPVVHIVQPHGHLLRLTAGRQSFLDPTMEWREIRNAQIRELIRGSASTRPACVLKGMIAALLVVGAALVISR